MAQRSFRKLWNAESSQRFRRIVSVFAAITAMLAVFQAIALVMPFLETLPLFHYDPITGEAPIPDTSVFVVMGLIGGFVFILVGTVIAPHGSRRTALGFLGGLFALTCCAGIPALIPPSHGIEFLFLGLVIGGMLAFIAVAIAEYRTSRKRKGDPNE